MKAIYKPRGPALEYAPWACNLYRGCGHGCLYCYAPACLRMKREEFFGNPQPRPGIIEALHREAPTYAGQEVLLCFTCDPYQPFDVEHQLTRQAIEILHEAGVKVALLTKGGFRAERDFDLLAARPELSKFGVTLTLTDPGHSAKWEPGAAPPAERTASLVRASGLGIETWVSMEPVLNPDSALSLIRATAHVVDTYKVGKWNHDDRAKRIDWVKFGREVVDLLEFVGSRYLIKDGLKEAMRTEP